jgi:hypothetical protein
LRLRGQPVIRQLAPQIEGISAHDPYCVLSIP